MVLYRIAEFTDTTTFLLQVRSAWPQATATATTNPAPTVSPCLSRRNGGRRLLILRRWRRRAAAVQIAEKRGKLKKRGVPDLESAARTVLDDWNSGRIPYFTLPPAEDPSVHVGAAVRFGPASQPAPQAS